MLALLLRNSCHMLSHDPSLYQAMRNSWFETNARNSAFWSERCDRMCSKIEHGDLRKFGYDYDMTAGFGDSRKIPDAKRLSFLKSMRLKRALERIIADARYFMLKSTRSFSSDDKRLSARSFAIASLMSSLRDDSTHDLKINRYIIIDGKRLPWRYLMACIYVDIIISLLDECGESFSSFDKIISSGIFVDIGGGYGAMTDVIYTLKDLLGVRTPSCILDQFPVSYIAQRYLQRVTGINVDFVEGSHEPVSMIGVMHPDPDCSTAKTSNLNASLFFNSHSFQEMDDDIIHEYCKFIQVNSCELSPAYLACSMYKSTKTIAGHYVGPDRVLGIIEKYFKVSGCVSLAEHTPGASIKGILDFDMYLFRVS